MENTIIMEDARIVFRNFAGKEGMYNREGDRNFCVLLDQELANELLRDGWNVKTLKPREEGDEEQPYLQVSVGFKVMPPKLVMITSKGRNDILEDMLELLDWVDIAKVDLIIRPYKWNVSGKSGTKAYLKSFFVTIQEDPLELKYADVPEVGYVPRLEIEGSSAEVIEGEIV